MPKTKAKFNSKQGLSMLMRGMPQFVFHFIEIEKEAYEKGDYALCLRCHEIGFPYCFPKLAAIAMNPLQEEGLRILKELKKAKLLDAQAHAQVYPHSVMQITAGLEPTDSDSASQAIEAEAVEAKP